jgi:hypothetical protein
MLKEFVEEIRKGNTSVATPAARSPVTPARNGANGAFRRLGCEALEVRERDHDTDALRGTLPNVVTGITFDLMV